MNFLVTGATGNIGIELIRRLVSLNSAHRVIAGVRNIQKARMADEAMKDVECRVFDFEDVATHAPALREIDIVFLLRPPHISDIARHFAPLVSNIKSAGVAGVVFLSVQGAESTEIIPHRKIERLILEHQLDHVFLRPSYFMQNLTTTLLKEIQAQGTITLPSGSAKFNWVDIRDIADLAAEFLLRFAEHKNRSYVVSGSQNLSFPEVIDRLNAIARTRIRYRSVGPVRFFLHMKKLGIETGMIVVMFLLHFFPRLQGEPAIASTYRDIFHRQPGTIDAFLELNKDKFL